MISKKLIAAVLGLTFAAGAPALAEGAKIYAYEGAGNFCPAGLQPVTISGVICCGVPNAGSYQKAMMHATPRKKVHSHVKRHKHMKTHTHAKSHSHMSSHSHTKNHSH